MTEYFDVHSSQRWCWGRAWNWTKGWYEFKRMKKRNKWILYTLHKIYFVINSSEREVTIARMRVSDAYMIAFWQCVNWCRWGCAGSHVDGEFCLNDSSGLLYLKRMRRTNDMTGPRGYNRLLIDLFLFFRNRPVRIRYSLQAWRTPATSCHHYHHGPDFRCHQFEPGITLKIFRRELSLGER